MILRFPVSPWSDEWLLQVSHVSLTDRVEGDWLELYLDAPDSEYSEEQAEFFSDINEKLAFTTSLPTLDDGSRGDGWVLADEFRQWLQPLLTSPNRPA
jgi:hypothetical protein